MFTKISIPFFTLQSYIENKYKEEFDKINIESNIQRCKNAAAVLIIINLVSIIIDLTIYKPMRLNTPQYLYLYYSHIFMIMFILLWLFLLKVNLRSNNHISERVLYNVLANAVLYWCVFLDLNEIRLSGHISAYIIGVLVCSSYLYLRPLLAFFTYGTSFLIFCTGLGFIIDDRMVLYSEFVNTVIVVVISMIISYINYVSLQKSFSVENTMLSNKIEINDANKKLKEYEKVIELLLANISHEMRTPLNVINCALQMLDFGSKQDTNTNRVQDYYKMIKLNTYRLLRLANNFVDITKFDSGTFELKLSNVDIVKVVEGITMSVASHVKDKGIVVVFDTQIEEKVLACDADLIERVVLNLLSNAVKFSKKNAYILVNIYLKDTSLCISVKDDGIGISDDMRKLIFEKFIQADKSFSRKREGIGIGLSLVKSIVELHGGNIYVNSELDKGSEFIIEVPITLVEGTDDKNCRKLVHCGIQKNLERINIEFSDIY